MGLGGGTLVRSWLRTGFVAVLLVASPLSKRSQDVKLKS